MIPLLFASVLFGLAACGPQQRMIGYREARHYYFCGDTAFTGPLRITSEDELNASFAPAAVMTRDGEPTKIDFAKAFAVARILLRTDRPTTVEPVALQRTRGGTLLLTYRVSRREPSSWIMHPFVMLFVNRRYVNLPFEAVEVTD